MASFRSQSRSGLRREAYLPLSSASRIPFLLVFVTLIVLTAAVADTVIWSQGAERRQLIQRVQNAEVAAELLRFENERLRHRLLEQALEATEREVRRFEETQRHDGVRDQLLAAPAVESERTAGPSCAPSDPLCGL